MKKSNKKFFSTITALVVAAVFVGGQSVFAADTSITGGDLGMKDLPQAGNFDSVTLDGTVQTTNATLDAFTVTDARGTGDGWNVTVKATQFTNITDSQKTLPLDSLAIDTPIVTVGDGSSDLTTITTMNGTIDNAVGLKLLSAAMNGGMGIYNVAENNLTLTLQPKDVKAGTYSSEITVTLVSGP